MAGSTQFSSIKALYAIICFASIVSLLLSLWVAPYYETAKSAEISAKTLWFAVEAGAIWCPTLAALQLITGFYIAVRSFEGPVRWKFLLLVTLIGTSVFWVNETFGVIDPFYDSWD